MEDRIFKDNRPGGAAGSVLLRAEDEPVASRLDYWRHVLGDAVVPMDVRFDQPAFRSQLVVGELGAVRVAEVDEGPGEARRTPRHIRRSDPDVYQVLVQTRGHMVGEQDDKQAIVGPGDFGLTDPSRPFRCAHPGRRAVCLTFPRTLLPIRRDDVAQLTGQRIPGGHGTGALLSSVVRQLPHNLGTGSGSERARLGTAVLDLLTVALAERLDRASLVQADTRQRALLLCIQAFIEERLGDPELSPGLIAAAHHISLRYLHRLFETTGTTVASWVRDRRLERCRRDLLDPTLSIRPAHAVGAKWGFAEPAHFSRAFRAAYGMPPGEYRRVKGR
ncbi:MAG: helix-turn-helix domain-containing protein [Streptosporangiales bacterium]|nr:helix-turn-helix domain-containing protein [Streptosporangiales bacterium]